VSSLTNIVHVTSWLSRAGGGIPPVIWNLAQNMSRPGLECWVAGLQDRWDRQDHPESVAVVSGAVHGPTALGYSRELQRRVAGLVHPRTVIHAHGLWMHPGIVARQNSRRMNCPLVISPHGMLEPWALQNSRWKKRLAAWLFENNNLQSAHCLHALCAAEAQHFRNYGLRNPIAVIPNGVDASRLAGPKTDLGDLLGPNSVAAHPRAILFLSRLHPKKGLENLLAAWRGLAADYPQWRLIIAGAGEPAYEETLRQLIHDHDLARQVLIYGAAYGEEKRRLLLSVDGFVLPSFSEGFSVAILEAAAAGLPIVLTPECNFPELTAAGAAFEISPSAPTVEAGLRQLMKLSAAERHAMGERGRKLVQQSYTWPVIADQMLSAYRWLLGTAPRPACVI
jgi:glycosyltransferase involved in cell wall biosynthesis